MPLSPFARMVDDWTAIFQQKTRAPNQEVTELPPSWSQEDQSVIMRNP